MRRRWGRAADLTTACLVKVGQAPFPHHHSKDVNTSFPSSFYRSCEHVLAESTIQDVPKLLKKFCCAGTCPYNLFVKDAFWTIQFRNLSNMPNVLSCWHKTRFYFLILKWKLSSIGTPVAFKLILRQGYILPSNVMVCWALAVSVVCALLRITFCFVTITHFAFHLHCIFTYTTVYESMRI